MLTLDDLKSMQRPTDTVAIRGTTWTIRALLARERMLIDAAYPPPPVPTKKHLNTGEETPLPDSPGYQVDRQKRFHAMTCAIVAVALDYGVGGQGFPFQGAPGDRKAWIDGAADELGAVFTDDELEHLYHRIDELEKSGFTQKDRIGTEGKSGNS